MKTKKPAKKRDQICWMVKGCKTPTLFPHTAAPTKRESIRRYICALLRSVTAYGDDEDKFAAVWKDEHVKGFRCVKVKLTEVK